MHTEMMQTASKAVYTCQGFTHTFVQSPLSSDQRITSLPPGGCRPRHLQKIQIGTAEIHSPEIQTATAENPCPVSALGCVVMECLAALGKLLSEIK